MKTILWACDFSEDSMSALGVARDLAAHLEARIKALYVAKPPSRVEREKGSWLNRINGLRKKLTEISGEAGAEAVFVESERVARTIVETAENQDAFLIAMGRAGMVGPHTQYAGPTARKVLQISERPVLLTRNMGMIPKLDRVLVTTDMSKASLKALDLALPIAEKLASPLDLLFVFEFVEMRPTPKEEEEVREQLRDLVRRERGFAPEQKGINPVVISGPEAGPGIARYITDNNIPLTIMSARGISGLEKWVLGSVTDQVVKLSPWPLIVVKE